MSTTHRHLIPYSQVISIIECDQVIFWRPALLTPGGVSLVKNGILTIRVNLRDL